MKKLKVFSNLLNYFCHSEHFSRSCLYADQRFLFVASRGCNEFPRRTMLWAWVTPYHLLNIATGMCLTGEL